MFISVRDLETISFNAIIDDLSAQNNECKKDNQEPNKRKDLPANQNGNESGVLDLNNSNYVTVNVKNEQHNPMMPDKLILNHAQINNLDFFEEGIEFVGGEQPNKVYNDIKENQFLSKNYEVKDNEINDNMNAQEKNKSIKNVIRCNEITVSAIKNETFENGKIDLPISEKFAGNEKDDFDTYNYNFESKDQEVEKERKNYCFYLSTGSLIVCSMLMVLLYVKLKNAN
ncbi:hypothetical protein NBO_18g0005 [Nosema bombycis CQ1]|uniref:Uncharacterized protein n=1 Tax=Nosema bombycis (strain CQ1 / CVCC 102059) TaxID=578461 RepID=R0MP76_NOSB1|nr:hypothetical protein NBO_18g0005 [Nosema bombycis CQ1]|eukprot:EOB14678.1 hypothetical protein NBO_18g0005 [Nosema bombycis CQ1]